MDWTQKHDFIWNNIKANATLGAYHETDVIKESVITSFQNEWDIMPAGRRKVIHGIGAICPFSVDVPAGSPFTGLFKPGGTIHGLIRMGPAANIMGGGGLTPGAAVKFLRTGTKSANIFLLDTTNPLPDNNHNFFARPLKNHITGEANTIATVVLNKKFCSTGHCITKVGLSDVCAYDQDGNQAGELNFPFKVTFDLTGEVNFNEAPPADMDEFIDQFRNLPVGTRLYTISAMRHPDDAEGFSIGDVVTTDNCVSSYYGDTKLFFKHQWIEDDISLRPQWTNEYGKDCNCNIPSA